MASIPPRTLALPAAWLVASLLCGGDARAGSEVTPETDAKVRELWATLDACWNERAAGSFSELFTEDVSFRFVDRDESLEGRTMVREHFGARFPGFAPELRHLTTVRDVRTIAADVLAVDGTVEILREDSGETAKPALLRTFAIFAVMLRESGGWKVRAIRIYQLPQPAAATAGSTIAVPDPRPEGS